MIRHSFSQVLTPDISRESMAEDTRSETAGTAGTVKSTNTFVFWKLVFPILTLILLLFILVIVFTIPDWALDGSCESSLIRIQKEGLSPSK